MDFYKSLRKVLLSAQETKLYSVPVFGPEPLSTHNLKRFMKLDFNTLPLDQCGTLHQNFATPRPPPKGTNASLPKFLTRLIKPLHSVRMEKPVTNLSVLVLCAGVSKSFRLDQSSQTLQALRTVIAQKFRPTATKLKSMKVADPIGRELKSDEDVARLPNGAKLTVTYA